MDQSHLQEPELASETTLHHLEPSRDQLTGAFFPNARNFVLSGGRFKSTTNIYQAAPSEPPPFRMISMGDLDLQHEIRLNSDTGVVARHPVRRMHSARVYGSASPMTVAIYEGDNAEEEWRKAISRHSNLRHPSIIQLFGTARTSTIHAAVFHDELIPATQMLEKYKVSPIGVVYFRYFLDRKFLDIEDYVRSVSGSSLDEEECTLWLRPSTGRLCVELSPDDVHLGVGDLDPIYAGRSPLGDRLLELNHHSKIINSMSLCEYHWSCFLYLDRSHCFSIPSHISVNLGAINHIAGADYESSIEVAFIYDPECHYRGWSPIPQGLILGNGWARIPSAEVDHMYHCSICTGWWEHQSWLSQATHIFKSIGITCGYEDYVSIHRVRYQLCFSGPPDGVPSGYLFLCPTADFCLDAPSSFRTPDCPAYWSLDPTGVGRLSMEEAATQGFPAIELEMVIGGSSWDATIYEGLRQFHEAKGFDPYTQDVARHLGHRLYQLSDAWEGSFADETNSENEDDEAIHSQSPTGSQIVLTNLIAQDALLLLSLSDWFQFSNKSEVPFAHVEEIGEHGGLNHDGLPVVQGSPWPEPVQPQASDLSSVQSVSDPTHEGWYNPDLYPALPALSSWAGFADIAAPGPSLFQDNNFFGTQWGFDAGPFHSAASDDSFAMSSQNFLATSDFWSNATVQSQEMDNHVLGATLASGSGASNTRKRAGEEQLSEVPGKKSRVC